MVAAALTITSNVFEWYVKGRVRKVCAKNVNKTLMFFLESNQKTFKNEYKNL